MRLRQLRGRLLSIRQNCEPEARIVLDGVITDTDGLMDTVEKITREVGLQTDDIIIGVDDETAPPRTFVTIRALRHEMDLETINGIVDFMDRRYGVSNSTIRASTERRDLIGGGIR